MLAVGRLSLANIDWDGLKQPEIQDYIHNSLFDVHAGKMYFASETKWWADFDKTPHLTVSDTPLRQTFHYNDSEATGMHVLNTGYLDSNTCKANQIRFAYKLQANICTKSSGNELEEQSGSLYQGYVVHVSHGCILKTCPETSLYLRLTAGLKNGWPEAALGDSF